METAARMAARPIEPSQQTVQVSGPSPSNQPQNYRAGNDLFVGSNVGHLNHQDLYALQAALEASGMFPLPWPAAAAAFITQCV